MTLRFDDDVEHLRGEIRAFIAEHLPEDIRRRVERGQELDRETHMRWHRRLYEHGWAAPGWPKEHGGCGWDLPRQFVFEQELSAAFAPRLLPFNIDMVGPMFIHFGTPEQQARFLPPALSGEHWWCQGFSEPNAGSDLASLRCRAERDGDDYVIDGTKLWTTNAHCAEWMFALVRTDSSGRKQHGITMLLIDMRSAGVSIRPMRTFDGGFEVNQCFFDAVRVPCSLRIGTEHEGWGIAKFLLSLERLGIAEVARSRAMLARVRRLAAQPLAGSPPLVVDDPAFAARLDEIEMDLMALEVTERRMLFRPGSDDLGAEAAILKLRGTEIQQRISEYAVEALGGWATVDLPPETLDAANHALPPAEAAHVAAHYFNLRKISIYGGSNEIQRNIVAKAVLGL